MGHNKTELLRNVDDGRGQAASGCWLTASMPSMNFTPVISFGNCAPLVPKKAPPPELSADLPIERVVPSQGVTYPMITTTRKNWAAIRGPRLPQLGRSARWAIQALSNLVTLRWPRQVLAGEWSHSGEGLSRVGRNPGGAWP